MMSKMEVIEGYGLVQVTLHGTNEAAYIHARQIMLITPHCFEEGDTCSIIQIKDRERPIYVMETPTELAEQVEQVLTPVMFYKGEDK